MKKFNQTICSYDWDDVFYVIRKEYAEFSDDRARHKALSNVRFIPFRDYLAAN